jgi:hypothetical protein
MEASSPQQRPSTVQGKGEAVPRATLLAYIDRANATIVRATEGGQGWIVFTTA